jgi:hypothetical protein
MNIDDVVLVATVREKLRDELLGKPLRISTTAITRRIEVVQAETLGHATSASASLANPEKDAAEEQAVAGSCTEADSQDPTEGVILAILPEKANMRASREYLVGPVSI